MPDLEDTQPFARGMTAEIYRYDASTVLKLFYPHIPAEWAGYEASLARAVSASGAEAPAFYGAGTVAGRKGLFSEFIAGPTLLAMALKAPLGCGGIARLMAAEQHKLHRLESGALPDHIQRFTPLVADSGRIIPGRVEAILDKLRAMSPPRTICHGDYHPGNVIFRRGGCVAVDWMNCYAGDPAGDVFRTYLTFASPFVGEGAPLWLRALAKPLKAEMARHYVREYLRLSGMAKADLLEWSEIVIAARLNEGIPGEREWLLAALDGGVRLLDFN